MSFNEDNFMDDLDNKWSQERRDRFVHRMKHKWDAKYRRNR